MFSLIDFVSSDVLQWWQSLWFSSNNFKVTRQRECWLYLLHCVVFDLRHAKHYQEIHNSLVLFKVACLIATLVRRKYITRHTWYINCDVFLPMLTSNQSLTIASFSAVIVLISGLGFENSVSLDTVRAHFHVSTNGTIWRDSLLEVCKKFIAWQKPARYRIA